MSQEASSEARWTPAGHRWSDGPGTLRWAWEPGAQNRAEGPDLPTPVRGASPLQPPRRRGPGPAQAGFLAVPTLGPSSPWPSPSLALLLAGSVPTPISARFGKQRETSSNPGSTTF